MLSRFSLTRERAGASKPAPARLQNLVGEEQSAGVPRLAVHAARRIRLTVQPFVEGPVAHFVHTRQLDQFALRRIFEADGCERSDPEAADERPDTAVVILPSEVLL